VGFVVLNLLEEKKSEFITGIYYGYDLSNLYMRIDLMDKAEKYFNDDYFIVINFYSRNKGSCKYRLDLRNEILQKQVLRLTFTIKHLQLQYFLIHGLLRYPIIRARKDIHK